MEITEVRIKLMADSPERLLAFCSLTIDGCFVIRDLKIIRGTRGSFVAMPSRKLTGRCGKCGGKNALRSHYCNHCGRRLNDDRAARASDGRPKLYADIAHPINSECRDVIQHRVMEAYEHELVLAQQPDYVCRYDDYGEEFDQSDAHEFDEPLDAGRIAASGDHRARTAEAAPTAAHGAATAATDERRPGRRIDRVDESVVAGPHTLASTREAGAAARREDFGDGLL